MTWAWLGRVHYADAVAAMEARRERVLAGDDSAQAVLLCEHEAVITLGRSATRGHILAGDDALAARGVEVHATNRGGDVTYHGPGQLMVYPVVRVRGSVVGFLATVAGVLAEHAADLGAAGAEFRRCPAGLWLGDDKLAACGLHLRRGISIHGWALDLATPPDAWRMIVPCGIAGRATVSVERASGRPPPPVAEVAAKLGPAVASALADAGCVSVWRSRMPPSPALTTAALARSSWSTTRTTTTS